MYPPPHTHTALNLNPKPHHHHRLQEFKGWRLPPRRPALGVQMTGDRAFTLIPADAPLPAVGRQVFTTVHDNQAEICVLVLRVRVGCVWAGGEGEAAGWARACVCVG